MSSVIGTTRKPDIYFRKSGQIDITARVTEDLGLSPGDSLDIWQEGGEYYLYARKNPDSRGRKAVCRPSNKRGRFMRAHSKTLTDYVTRLTGTPEAYLLVGSLTVVNNTSALPLLIKSNTYDQVHKL